MGDRNVMINFHYHFVLTFHIYYIDISVITTGPRPIMLIMQMLVK